MNGRMVLCAVVVSSCGLPRGAPPVGESPSGPELRAQSQAMGPAPERKEERPAAAVPDETEPARMTAANPGKPFRIARECASNVVLGAAFGRNYPSHLGASPVWTYGARTLRDGRIVRHLNGKSIESSADGGRTWTQVLQTSKSTW